MIKKTLKFFIRPIYRTTQNMLYKKRLKKSSKFNSKRHIVFICQCEYIFNKTRDIVHQLIQNQEHVTLYIVKDNLSVSNESITIFEKEFPEICCKFEEKSLKDIKPSIVFYTRPYENYLPKELKFKNVLKYSKIAYIPYYFSLEKEYGLNVHAYKQINYYFADCKDDFEYFNDLCKKNISLGIQKAFYLGYPVLDNLFTVKGDNYFKNENALKVIWTPRWTFDKNLGGSNFLRYYKEIFSKFVNNNEYSFIFRPHPMLFSNIRNNSILSNEEVDDIILKLKLSSNSYYDVRSEYIDTFQNSDILITDNSSIVVEYFLTGKPIIYCYNESNVIFNDTMNTILDCNYVANNFEEIEMYLELLKEKDIKKEKRLLEVKKLMKYNLNSAEKIAKAIEEL